MKLISASFTAAVLLGIGALVHSTASYAQMPYCLPQCPSLNLQCIKGDKAACEEYSQLCTNCMERSAGGQKQPTRHDIIADNAWLDLRQTTLTH